MYQIGYVVDRCPRRKFQILISQIMYITNLHITNLHITNYIHFAKPYMFIRQKLRKNVYHKITDDIS